MTALPEGNRAELEGAELDLDAWRLLTCWKCRERLRARTPRAAGAHVMPCHLRDEHKVSAVVICTECWPAMPERVRALFAKAEAAQLFLDASLLDYAGLLSVPSWGALP